MGRFGAQTRRGLSVVVAVLLIALGLARGNSAEPPRPNLIVIMADDLGYETLGANGGTSYRTPHLDKLAAGGVRFTHCFAQPLCTPTRVQLMTGLYNVRNYRTFGTMDRDSVTFANLLKAQGYATCVAGKWQLGRAEDLPKAFGFDEACLWQHTRRPPRYANPGLEINGDAKDYSDGEYGPDIVNDFALDFIERHQREPFFLYYPMILTHSPYQPTPDSPDWDRSARGEGANNAKHFGEMVEYMDKLIGKLVTKLDELSMRDNTLLLFLGDNGTGHGVRSQMGERFVLGGKGTTKATGMHVPLIVSWPKHAAVGRVCDDLVDTTDFLPTLLDAAGTPASDAKFDGRSFLAQVRGEKGSPRDWIYSWYWPHPSRNTKPVEFAFSQQFKLYRTGEFVAWQPASEKEETLPASALSSEAAAGRRVLEQALEQFRNSRPSHFTDGAAKSSKRKKNLN